MKQSLTPLLCLCLLLGLTACGARQSGSPAATAQTALTAGSATTEAQQTQPIPEMMTGQQTAAAARSDAAARPAADPAAAPASAAAKTESGVTEIAPEQPTTAPVGQAEIYWEAGVPKADGTRGVTTDKLLRLSDIQEAAYRALDHEDCGAVRAENGFVSSTHNAAERADGFEVVFNTGTETITVRLDQKLNVRGVTRRAAGSDVSGAYNPSN